MPGRYQHSAWLLTVRPRVLITEIIVMVIIFYYLTGLHSAPKLLFGSAVCSRNPCLSSVRLPSLGSTSAPPLSPEYIFQVKPDLLRPIRPAPHLMQPGLCPQMWLG